MSSHLTKLCVQIKFQILGTCFVEISEDIFCQICVSITVYQVLLFFDLNTDSDVKS